MISFDQVFIFNLLFLNNFLNNFVTRLNAGWSIHTGIKTVKKDPQLTEAELIEIQKVLQRSEMLEQNERDRVM